MRDVRVVIIGAGPTGLGAAWRLTELGHADWMLFEAKDQVGGLAGSVTDSQGFTWDFGCHVLHSHYTYVDALLDHVLGELCLEHAREAWVWMRERWIPYPVQFNLWRLPPDEATTCLNGLVEARRNSLPKTSVRTFEDWLCANFGLGLFTSFMKPYNFKVWACPPAEMDVGWMRERIPPVDLRRLVRNFALRRDDRDWGPNARFRFPLRGGTGAVWNGLCKRLPQDRVRLGHEIVSVDPIGRTIVLHSGKQIRYDALISTMPLDRLLRRLSRAPELTHYAGRFVCSGCHVIGLGFEGMVPLELRDKSWVYFPEAEFPFQRVTVFSNYSPYNVPRPGKQWSLLAEVSTSPHKPVDARTVVGDTLAGLQRCGFVGEQASIEARWHSHLEYGYPTPWLGRDRVLAPINRELEEYGIFSRGRFGAWKYEVSNQDHSVMQGVEIVERILQDGTEYTFNGEMRDSIQPIWSKTPLPHLSSTAQMW